MKMPLLHPLNVRCSLLLISINTHQISNFDALGGWVLEATDYGLDEHTGAVFWGLDDDALPLVVTFVLPLGLDADAVADLEIIQ